jgi:hypothetical protein
MNPIQYIKQLLKTFFGNLPTSFSANTSYEALDGVKPKTRKKKTVKAVLKKSQPKAKKKPLKKKK